MLKVVCLKCKRFFRTKKTGVLAAENREAFPDEGGEVAVWIGYRVWRTDLLECEGCGAQVVSGFGREPAIECFGDGFEKWRERAEYEVNDG